MKIAYRPRAFRALVTEDCESLRARAELGDGAERRTAEGVAAAGVVRDLA